MRSSLTGFLVGGAFAVLAGNAGAVVFDGQATRVFKTAPALAALDLLLYDEFGTPTGTSATARLEGTVTLGPRSGTGTPLGTEGDVGRDGTAPITFDDILDFDLIISLPTDRDGTLATVPVTPDLGGLDLIAGSLSTDGTNLILDASGVSPGFPLLQITRDRFPKQLLLPPSPGFPNGQRYGDDVGDQLLLQLVAGSVNAVAAALPDGFAGPPGAVAFGGITPDSTLLLGTASVVPLPAGLVLMASATGLLVAFRRFV